MNKAKNTARKAVNIILIIMVLGAWAVMTFVKQEGALAATGIVNLRYFTVLSNLLAGAAAAVFLFGGGRGRFAAALKHIAAVAVTITFLVVVAFFWPVFGPEHLFNGPNILFHVVIPLLAIAEEIWLAGGGLSRRDDLFSALPPLIYGLFYLVNILINGVGTWPDGNDWYGFATWGIPVGLVIFAAICLAAVLISAVLRAAGRIKTRCANG